MSKKSVDRIADDMVSDAVTSIAAAQEFVAAQPAGYDLTGPRRVTKDWQDDDASLKVGEFFYVVEMTIPARNCLCEIGDNEHFWLRGSDVAENSEPAAG